jgi:hypothetical protein
MAYDDQCFGWIHYYWSFHKIVGSVRVDITVEQWIAPIAPWFLLILGKILGGRIIMT